MKTIHLLFRKLIWCLLVWLGLLGRQPILSQSIPDIQWSKATNSLAISTDGNIVSTTLTPRGDPAQGGGVPGVVLVTYSLQGDLIQSTVLDGATPLAGRLGLQYTPIGSVFHIAPTTDGGLVVVGREYGTGTVVYTKVRADGHQVFVNPVRVDYFYQTPNAYDTKITYDDLIGTPDGGFLLLVTSAEPNAKTIVFYTKYDANGNASWTKSAAYPTSQPANPDRSLTKAQAIINTPDGGFLIGGYYNTTGAIIDLNDYNSIESVGWIAKLDGEGNVIWHKLLNNFPIAANTNGPIPGSIVEMLFASDVAVASDGNGYAIVGSGIVPSSVAIPPPTTSILELDGNGNFKRARSLGVAATQAFITSYPAKDGSPYYAIGNTSKSNGTDPQLLKVNPASLSLNDPNLFKVVAQRIFDGSSDSFLQALNRAGDGSLVFATTIGQVVKLQTEPSASGLTIDPPTYNCSTGAIHFNTSGGNGSPIEFMAPGITGWTTNADQILDECARNCADIPPFLISARQSGQVVTYSWSRQNYCATTNPIVRVGTIPDQTVAVGQSVYFPIGGYFGSAVTTSWIVSAQGLPPGISTFFRQEGGGSPGPTWVLLGTATTPGVYMVTASASANGGSASTTFKFTVTDNTNPPTTNFALTEPTYNCSTGAIHFNTSGGNGSPIEFMAPGITGWTTNADQILDECARNCADIPPFLISARQSGQVVTYSWSRQNYCATTNPIVRVGTIPDQTVAVGQSVYFPIGGYFGSAVTTSWIVSAQGLPPGISTFFRQEGGGSPGPTWVLLGTATTPGVYMVTASASANGGSASTTFKFTVTDNTNPPTTNFALTEPTYNCSTGAIHFNTSGGNGSPIEFMAPGITGWTTNADQILDECARNCADIPPFLISARQSGQVVTYSWSRQNYCGQARLGVTNSDVPFQLQVLGNPVHEIIMFEITGAEKRPIKMQLTNSRGQVISTKSIDNASSNEHHSFDIRQQPAGFFLLNVASDGQLRQVKVLKQ
ncbi:T9SS type A sorting domain-containing protein [Spirosoma sp. SC4-14]|uniref:T9SS type A sorting domain-containing protein n=1 Tax=Spirosoma sp. SC4-14 TaxID=3128900 RepID=UPI0030CCE38D